MSPHPDMAQAYRIEKDTLGIVSVPINALYGAQTQRAIDNFPVSGLLPWKAFIWSMVVVKMSAARVNRNLGLLDRQIAQKIEEAALEIISGKWDDQFRVDPFQAGAGTSHNMNVNEVIANRATQLMGGELGQYQVHPNDHVNMCQSTNDTIPTAIRLGCLWRLNEMGTSIHELASVLDQKAIQFDQVIKSGRTHLQDAVPIRLGQEFSGYASAVHRDLERIQRAADGLRRLPIGGTATGTGLNAPLEYHPAMVRELQLITGIQLYTSDNLFEGMQSMADMVDFSAAMRTLALTLIRIANDVRLLASGPSTGLDEIRLPPVQPGSSIMPGKVNPVLAEMLNMAMFHIVGCDTTVSLAAQAGQLELNVMMPIIAHELFEMMQVMIGAVNAFSEKCVKGIQANSEKAEGWLQKNAILVTALNPIIGYAVGAELVKEAHLLNRSVYEVARQKAMDNLLFKLNSTTPVSPEEIDAAFKNLRQLTEGGIIGGNAGG